MRLLQISVALLIVGIVLPAFVVGTTSTRAEAIPPSLSHLKVPAGELPVPWPMPAAVATMVDAKHSKDDATSFLALKRELNLQPEQILRLEEIREQSRERASALLTSEQRASMAVLTQESGQPNSMNAAQRKSPAHMEASGERKE